MVRADDPAGRAAPVLSRPGDRAPDGAGGLNGWARLVGVVGVPGAIAVYLVWWLTQGVGSKLDRMILLLEQIARALRVQGF